jgi:hypothetical protein
MKITYETIRHNLDAYHKARTEYVVLRQFEEGSVDYSALTGLGLAKFGAFYNFLKKHKERGFDPISDPSIAIFAKLKEALIEKTSTTRFKTFLKNRSKKKFDAMLADKDEFDRLLNGAWKSRPVMRRNGRMGSGTRKQERIEGLEQALLPLINYIILNEIEVTDRFSWQDRISSDLDWFISARLSFSGIRTKEIEMTSSLIKAFSDLVEKEKFDFRKLNLSYVMSGIEKKIKKAFTVAEGTMLKCVEEVKDGHGAILLNHGSVYQARGCYESRGSLLVSVMQDNGSSAYHEFSKFEDISTKRDDLLSMLLD